MKTYKVTYYDGKGKKNLFVKANSSNQAVAEAKERLRTNKVIDATIVGAERLNVVAKPFEIMKSLEFERIRQGERPANLNFYDWIAEGEKKKPIRDPKHIECLIKGKEYKYGKGRTH